MREIYKIDFEAFGDRWTQPTPKPVAELWSPDAIRTVAWRSESNERIGDLSRELRRLRANQTQQRVHQARTVREWLRERVAPRLKQLAHRAATRATGRG